MSSNSRSSQVQVKRCPYCANQGLPGKNIRILTDRRGKVEPGLRPGTIRAKCDMGHIFPIPAGKVA